MRDGVAMQPTALFSCKGGRADSVVCSAYHLNRANPPANHHRLGSMETQEHRVGQRGSFGVARPLARPAHAIVGATRQETRETGGPAWRAGMWYKVNSPCQ